MSSTTYFITQSKFDIDKINDQPLILMDDLGGPQGSYPEGFVAAKVDIN